MITKLKHSTFSYRYKLSKFTVNDPQIVPPNARYVGNSLNHHPSNVAWKNYQRKINISTNIPRKMYMWMTLHRLELCRISCFHAFWCFHRPILAIFHIENIFLFGILRYTAVIYPLATPQSNHYILSRPVYTRIRPRLGRRVNAALYIQHWQVIMDKLMLIQCSFLL